MSNLAYVGAVTIAAVIGVLLGVSLIEVAPTEEPWLYNYQALVAGGLAVIAAGGTILTMVHVDRKQQVRHENLMSINLRPVRLEVQRLLAATVTEARDIINTAGIVFSEFDRGEQTVSDQWAMINRMRKIAHHCAEAAKHLDGETAIRVEDFRLALSDLDSATTSLANLPEVLAERRPAPDLRGVPKDQWEHVLKRRIKTAAKNAVFYLRIIDAALTRMEHVYKIPDDYRRLD